MSWLLLATALAAEPVDAFHAGLVVERRALGTLTAWSGANLVGGLAAGLGPARAPQARAFHLTNAAWSVVNLGIAGAGLAGVHRRTRLGPPDGATLARQHRTLHRTLAVNLGLDVGYVAAGGLLWALSDPETQPGRIGTGQSLVLQGGFLLGFDAAFLALHRRAVRTPIALAPTLAPGGSGLAIAGRW